MPIKRSMDEVDAILTRPGSLFELTTFQHPCGATVKNYKNSPPNHRAFIEAQLNKFPNNILLSSSNDGPGRQRLTYKQTHDLAIRRAAWLRSKGVGVGTRVALAGENSNQWVINWIALHYLGAVPVYVNITLTLEANIHCLALAEPRLVLVDPETAGVFGPVRDQLSVHYVGELWCWGSTAKLSPAVRRVVPQIDDTKLTPALINSVTWGAGLEGLGPASDGCILFTSGTTGLPKAVISTQTAGLHNVISGMVSGARALLREGKIDDLAQIPPPAVQPSNLLVVPLFHATGGQAWLMRMLGVGGKLVFMGRWRVPDAIEVIKSEGVNMLGGVPAIPVAIINHPSLPKSQQFVTISYGGAPSPDRLVSDIHKKWPSAMVINGWGMTETSALHAALGGIDLAQHPNSCGRPVPCCEVKIVDQETKQEVAPGAVGVLLARGPNVMTRYLGNPKATRETLDADGWLDTGDMGRQDENGFVYIVDRAKDIIIRGGENISSVEVESALYLDDRVAEAAAVPVPDDKLGELVAALVSLRPGATATGASLRDAVAHKLRRHARPVIVVVHNELIPRNGNGKVIKTDCKEIVAAAWEKEKNAPRAKL